MAENVPPNGDTPGLPYYEKLKRDLRETIHKKRLLDKNVVSAFCTRHRGGGGQGKTAVANLYPEPA